MGCQLGVMRRQALRTTRPRMLPSSVFGPLSASRFLPLLSALLVLLIELLLPSLCDVPRLSLFVSLFGSRSFLLGVSRPHLLFYLLS